MASLSNPYARKILLRVANIPVANIPQTPHAPCTGKASRGSSTFKTIKSLEAPMYTKEPMNPIIMAAHGSTIAQEAVIDTRPDITPFKIIDKR
mmetsp:Transcript_196/g.308  ORF Transcript_196/g.308 Transcript_196/m.308 type:complete len:93 (-) Transcript_196:1092-1370(-)